MARHASIAIGLIALVWAVFAQVRGHDFVYYDDDHYIVENQKLRGGLAWENVVGWFTAPYETNYIPLSALSLQVDYALHGLDPAGYLLTNVALHTLSTLLLYAALARMTGARGRSAFVAAVFAVHPLHVESVAWASERKDVLAGFFFALGLLAWARYTERPGAGRFVPVLAILALGLLSKPTLVTFPFVLLLLDVWPTGRLARHGWRLVLAEKLALLLLVLAASAVTFWVQRDLGAMPAAPPPLPVRLVNAVHSYSVYLGRSFWPSGLAPFYPYPPRIVSPAGLLAELLLLGGLSAAAAASWRRRGYLLVGWLWFLGVLVPMIGLVQVGLQARADRYTYLAQTGLAVAVAWGAVDLGARLRVPRRAVSALGWAAVLALAVLAWQQVGRWRDTQTLFRHAVAVTEGNYLAEKVLGDVHFRAGRLPEAEARYRKSIAWKADYSHSHAELARVLQRLGRTREAVAHLQFVTRSDPGHAWARGELGALLLGLGEFEGARRELRLARREMGDDPRVLGDLAAAEQALGNLAEAAALGREALRLAPDHVPALLNLAAVLAAAPDPELRDPAEAERLLDRAEARLGEGHPDIAALRAAARDAQTRR